MPSEGLLFKHMCRSSVFSQPW